MAEYVCRLVMKLSGDEPSDAPIEFVRYLIEGGLIDWIYRVEEPGTGQILGYFDGHGTPIDMDSLIADDEPDQTGVETVELPDPASPATPLEVTITTSTTPTTESDEKLLALAESLTQTEQL